MPVNRASIIAVFTENRLLKLLALVLASISIYSIQRITSQLEEVEVPIEVDVREGVAILSQDARTAYVTCRGSYDDLKRIEPAQLKIVVSPQASGIAGTEQVPIGPRNLTGSFRGVTVIRVRPDIVNLTFDREIEKKVAVAKPTLVGKPLVGRAEVDFEPKIISVRGPRQQLADLKILRTAPIDIEGVAESFSRQLAIQTGEEAGIWKVDPARITAKVNIVTEAISKEWMDIPVMVLRPPQSNMRYTLSPTTAAFSVLGSPQAVNAIKVEDIRIFVDCAAITNAGSYSLPGAAFLGKGLDVSSAVNPSMFTVEARKLPMPTPVAKGATNAPGAERTGVSADPAANDSAAPRTAEEASRP